MQLQDLSYKLNNAVISVNDKNNGISYEVSQEVISLENVYTAPNVEGNNGEYIANKLVWGNDVYVDGALSLSINEDNNGLVFSSKATLDKPIRAIKTRFDHLPLGTLINSVDCDKEVTEFGICMHYPEGWRSMSWPFLAFRLENGRYLYVYSRDSKVNRKNFFIKKTGNNMRVDVVEEQDATVLNNTFTSPDIEVGIVDDIRSFYKSVSDHTKNVYGLSDFDDSPIVPNWLKDIHLVVTMHMEAFTGKIFHTYRGALEDIKRLTKYIDGKHILVYLAGWEGRYYYKYGNYTPDDRLGGSKGLEECVEGLHALGCKVMFMYGMNMVNRNIPNLFDVVKESEFVTMGGGRFHHGSVNWEGAHHYDFSELAQLNIGCKTWADELFRQIKSNVEQFDCDGAFLDIAACYVNDRNARLYDGVVEFCDRLRTIKPEFLVSGEGYYDGLSRAMPLFQSGHTEGWMHYHDRLDDELFTRFSREFAHLCLGDPSYGSTGVHEQGINTEVQTPLRKAIIPTLSLVDGSLDNGLEKTLEIIEQAKQYGGLFCEKTNE